MRYLPVTVYNPTHGNCSANGITETHKTKLVVPCRDGHITQESVDEFGYIVLELKEKVKGYVHFAQKNDTRWLMAGGAFVYTSDSRFSRAYGNYPIPVHDRHEG